ncbi:hypothetical protein [Mariniblastus fucicola]|nr:hypothetical protein [Mariniblastus fucicola]
MAEDFTELMREFRGGGPRFSSDGRDGWLFSVQPTSTDWMALLVNMSVAISIMVVVFVTCKRRWRNGFKFNLLDVVLVFALASLALANLQHHRDISHRETNQIHGFSLSNPAWSGPEFLRRLAGDSEWLGACRHYQKVSITISNLNAKHVDAIGALPYVRDLEIEGDPSLPQIELLGELTQLETIEIKYVMQFDSIPPSSSGFVKVLPPAQTPTSPKPNETESYESRIRKPNVTLPSIEELRIDSKMHNDNLPRAVDLIDCCPNLKKVNLTGDQYLIDDLMNLPSTIDKIECGFLTTAEELERLKAKFPAATIERKLKGGYMVATSLIPDRIAEIRTKRRREIEWQGSHFSSGTLDLSRTATKIDMAFAEKFRPVFPKTRVIVFGRFDSSDTAVWIAQQCPKLTVVDATGFELEFSGAMQLPESIHALTIEQNSTTSDQFEELIWKLGLSDLTITGSKFNDQEIKAMKKKFPSRRVVIRN